MDETKFYVKVGTAIGKPYATREDAEKVIAWHRKVGVPGAYITLIEPTKPAPTPAPVAPIDPPPDPANADPSGGKTKK